MTSGKKARKATHDERTDPSHQPRHAPDRAGDTLTQALKAYIGETVEVKIGRHTAYCKVVDAEDGKVVLDNRLSRERQHVSTAVIFDRQDEALRHEVGTSPDVKVLAITE